MDQLLAVVLSLAFAAAPEHEVKVAEIAVYKFDRKSGEMAPLDEKAEPFNDFGDMVAIVRLTGSGTTKAKLVLKVTEGKKKKFEEARSVEDPDGSPYEMFFFRSKLLCAETTFTATITRGKKTSTKTTTRAFSCGE
jgi:hypothetical protein